jgi:hypothetical protein
VTAVTGDAADRAHPVMEEAEEVEEDLAASTRSTRTRPAATTVSASAKTHTPAARRGAMTGVLEALEVIAATAPGAMIHTRDATAPDGTAETATMTAATADETGATGRGVAVMAEVMATTADEVEDGTEASAVVAEVLASRRRSRLCPTSSANPRQTLRPSPTSRSASAA